MEAFVDDYEWEPVEFTTDDGYILTTFIISKKGVDMPNPPIMVHHGNGYDAASWLEELQLYKGTNYKDCAAIIKANTPDPEPEPEPVEEVVEEEEEVVDEEAVDEEVVEEGDADAAEDGDEQ